MDPVMQTLFGKMPIEQLNSVQIAAGKSKNSNTILILGGATILLCITAYVLYQKNLELKRKVHLVSNNEIQKNI